MRVGSSRFTAQRDEDAAFFEDWICGKDQWGLWLWPEPRWRAIVIRPTNTGMEEIICHLGGERMAWHRYDSGHRRDWLIPARRWRELRAKLPELIQLRQRQMMRAPYLDLDCYKLFEGERDGRPVLATFTRANKAFAERARALGSRFSGNLLGDRAGWWIDREASGAADFRRLVEGMRAG